MERMLILGEMHLSTFCYVFLVCLFVIAPLVVAINKIDRREADVSRVLNELAMHGVVVEQLGGEVQSVEISALKRINLHGLLEALCLQAELMQIRSDDTGAAEGIILEANMEHGTGKVATCLVTRGQLRRTPVSGPLVAGETICSPRILLDDRGQPVASVGPGFIAKVAGWKELPPAGSTLLELKSMARAAEVVRFRQNQRMQKKASDDLKAYTARMAPYQAQYSAFLEERSKSSRSLWRKLSKNRPDLQSLILPTDEDIPSLPLLIKTDVHGSLEAIQTLLSTCPADECTIEIIQCGVGPLTESEVDHAEALGAIILLFNVSALPTAMSCAETKGVMIKRYNIIYRLAEDVREFINARLPPLIVEKVVASLGDVVATCYRVIRPGRTSPALHSPTDAVSTGSHDTIGIQPDDTIVVSQAVCRSLRHEKTIVDSVRKGVECGLVLTTPERPNEDAEKRTKVSVDQSENLVSNWQVGDLIQCYVLVKEPRKVQWEFETKSTEEVLGET
ncbi:translation initiation factor IF-2 [Paragonimus westermani]|uniref:Translation initiation factor IF-2 n=1 Tax=Paragonimus westermani TaxID=34504 RepID=A0A5J4NM57_9TREM|nr:translation initiation factor IF-2 [Paragonimus westermani]